MRPTASTRAATFQVIPAIDLLGGHCVRLYQGDYARETRYSDDPVSVARRWQELGAPLLHVVDLDGARAGRPCQAEIMAAIVAAVTVPVEVSGGLRTVGDVDAAFAYGAARVQLGSAAVHDARTLQAALSAHPGAICVSIDARDGKVATDGWVNATPIDAIEFARQLAAMGVPRIMATDIGRDSTMTGPKFDLLGRLVEELQVPIVASGGVASLDHLVRLAKLGCEGAIVGKALYEGVIELPAAIAAVGGA